MIDLRKKKDFTAEVIYFFHERHHVLSYAVFHHYFHVAQSKYDKSFAA